MNFQRPCPSSPEEDTDLELDTELERGKIKRSSQRLSAASAEGMDDSLSFTDKTGIPLPTLDDSVRSIETQGSYQHASTPVAEKAEEELDIKKVLLKLTKDIKKIRSNQRLILDNQELILNQQSATVNKKAVLENEVPVNLTIGSLEDLDLLEKTLLDSSMKDIMVKLASNGGGSNVDGTVKMILKRLLTDAVAQHYSWVGAKGKMRFCDLQLSKLVFVATRNNATLCATDTDIETSIKNWLRHAKVRKVKTQKLDE